MLEILIVMSIPLIMSMMMKPHKNKSIKIPQDYQYAQRWKDITRLYLPMDKLELGKLIQWRDSNTILQMIVEG